MKDYTIIPNELLRASQLSINARYLLCVLLRHCGSKEYCYPSQETLGKEVGLSARQVSEYIKELILNGLISKTRTGFNKPNTYKVAKSFIVENAEVIATKKKSASDMDKKSNSTHIRSVFPLHSRSKLPPNNTYLIAKDNNSYKFNPKTFAKFRASLEERGIIPKTKPLLRKEEKLTLPQTGNLAEVLAKKTKELTFKNKTKDYSFKSDNLSPHGGNPQYEHKDSSYEIQSQKTNKTNYVDNSDKRAVDTSHVG